MDAKVDDSQPSKMVTQKEVKYPRFKPTIFNDEKGNIRYVNAVVKCPCACLCLNLSIMFFMSIILLITFINVEDAGDIITDGSHDYVFSDVRSHRYGALYLADEQHQESDDEDERRRLTDEKRPRFSALKKLYDHYREPKTSSEALADVMDYTEGLEGKFGPDGRGQLTLEEGAELMGRIFSRAKHDVLRPGLAKASNEPVFANPRLRALEQAEAAVEAAAESDEDANFAGGPGRRLAYQYKEPSKSCSDDDLPLLREEMLDLMLLAYESEGSSNLFTESRLRRMREVELMLTEQADYESDFCMYEYNDDLTGFNCSKGLSPLLMYYASSWNSTLVQWTINELKDHTDLYNDIAYCVEYGVFCSTLTASQQSNLTWGQSVSAALSTIMDTWDGEGDLNSNPDEVTEFAAYMKPLKTRSFYVDYYFDNGFSISNQKSAYSRSMIYYGYPLAGGCAGGTDKYETDRENFKKYVMSEIYDDITKATDLEEDKDINIYYFMGAILFDVFIDLLLRDGYNAFGSIFVVYLYLVGNTGSWFLATFGMIEIIMSIPTAWFLYSCLFQLKYFAGLNMLAIFIVLAIGADDIFVFLDAYKQSAHEGPEVLVDLETRMSWVYRRAGTAMLITSATTCSAFLCTCFTPLAEIMSFGIMASLVILMDYIWVMTLFCTACTIYHNMYDQEGAQCPACPGTGKRKGIPCCIASGLLFLIAIGLMSNAVYIPAFLAFAMAFCFAVATPSACTCILCCCTPDACSLTKPSPTEAALKSSTGQSEQLEEPALVKFFGEDFADFILKPKTKFIVGGVVLVWLILSSVFMSMLRPVTASEDFLPADHPIQAIINILQDQFPSASQDEGSTVYLTWGLQEQINRDGVNQLFYPDKIGEVQYDNKFTANEQCLKYIMYDVCRGIQLGQELGDFVPPDDLSDFVGTDDEGFNSIDCILTELIPEKASAVYPPLVSSIFEEQFGITDIATFDGFGVLVYPI